MLTSILVTCNTKFLRRLTQAEIRRAIEGSDEQDKIPEIDTDADVPDHIESEGESDHLDEESDESDDADYEVGDEQNEMHAELEEVIEKFVGRDGTIWEPSALQRRRAPSNSMTGWNKVNQIPGQHIETSEHAFDSIVTREVIDIIVEYTNIEAQNIQKNWKHTDAVEIRAFIGLLISLLNKQTKLSRILRSPPWSSNFSCHYRFQTIPKSIAVYPFRQQNHKNRSTIA